MESRWSIIGEGYDEKKENKLKNKFEEHVDQYWEIIKKNYLGIEGLDSVLQTSRIGIIQLAELNALDAQNIFKRINSGGTKLTSAELLSAEPYWNKPFDQNASENRVIETLYRKLKLPFSGACRWDIPATLISRIDPTGVFFKSSNILENEDNVDTKEISYGFNIFSAIFVKGVSKVSLSNIAKKTDIWCDEVPQFIEDMKQVVSIIKDMQGVITLSNWSKNISDVLGATPTIELLTICYFNWIQNNRPKNGSKLNSFINDTKNHMDRLFREKIKNVWSGSADSTLADDIKENNWPGRISAIHQDEHDDWNSLISEMRKGNINGKAISDHKVALPLLYYAKMIEGTNPLYSDNGKDFDIDHVYPKALFSSNKNIMPNLMNSISNLEILESSVNKRKKDKKLNEIGNELFSPVSTYSHIAVEDFDKYSDINNFDQLDGLRGEHFREIFDIKRKSYLSNN